MVGPVACGGKGSTSRESISVSTARAHATPHAAVRAQVQVLCWLTCKPPERHPPTAVQALHMDMMAPVPLG